MGMSTQCRHCTGRSYVIRKEDAFGIDIADACDEKDALTALRQECQRVDSAIRPPIAALFEGPGEPIHGGALVELQHEGHVLEYNDWNTSAIQEPEDMIDKTGSLAVDPSCHASLRKILAREARREQIHGPRERAKLSYVRAVGDIRESLFENTYRGFPNLARQHGLVAGLPEAEFKPTNSCEQRGRFHCCRVQKVNKLSSCM
jgi:hypothetical protein